MSESAVRRVKALLVTHGRIGEALVDAAESIAGPIEDVVVLSNEGLSRDALIARVREEVARFGTDGGLVLVDIAGGSCAQASFLIASRGAPGPVPVLCGLNLPLFLDYLHNRMEISPRALAERLAARGQASVVLLLARETQPGKAV
ncbi:MAG: PTS sugar transporter subunit IIA [Candidatus Eiseniibacteriota bacterium]